MKFYIYQDQAGEWRWNAQSGGNILFSSGEGFEKPQKIVQVIRKNIIREDEALEKALVKALKTAGLNEKGGQDRKTASLPEASLKPLSRSKKKLEPGTAWPFPIGDKSCD